MDKQEGLNVLSLFDGMACGRLALDKANIPINSYLASEIDPVAVKVTRYKYSSNIHLGDVTKVTTDSLPTIDILIGGSPCQGFSFAGKQLNFEDPRSKLFFEFVRLLKETNPKYFLLENVNMKQEYQDIITEYLVVAPVMINSSLVSAQNRKRLYWTNIPIEPIEDKGITLTDIIDHTETNYKIPTNYYKYVPASEPLYCDPYNKSILTIKSNTLRTNTNNGNMWIKVKDGYRNLTRTECEKLQTVPVGYTAVVSEAQAKKMLGNGWTVDVITHIFKGIKDIA